MTTLLMFMAKRFPEGRVRRWAYMRCMKAYMRKHGQMLGYFKFAEDYLK